MATVKKFKQRSRLSKKNLLIILVLTALIGVITLFITHAATPSARYIAFRKRLYATDPYDTRLAECYNKQVLCHPAGKAVSDTVNGKKITVWEAHAGADCTPKCGTPPQNMWLGPFKPVPRNLDGNGINGYKVCFIMKDAIELGSPGSSVLLTVTEDAGVQTFYQDKNGSTAEQNNFNNTVFQRVTLSATPRSEYQPYCLTYQPIKGGTGVGLNVVVTSGTVRVAYVDQYVWQVPKPGTTLSGKVTIKHPGTCQTDPRQNSNSCEPAYEGSGKCFSFTLEGSNGQVDVKSDSNGNYNTSLVPGTYQVKPVAADPCGSQKSPSYDASKYVNEPSSITVKEGSNKQDIKFFAPPGSP